MKKIFKKLSYDLCFNWFNDIEKILKKNNTLLIRYLYFIVFKVRLDIIVLYTKIIKLF